MDDNGYLPDYYIRKKQRDRMYTNVWRIAALCLMIVAGVFVGSFLYKTVGVSLKNKGKPTVNKDQANELNELQTENRISEAIANRQDAGIGDLQEEAESDASNMEEALATSAGTTDPQELSQLNTDISDIDYSESFPLVTVSLEAGDPNRKGNPPAESDTAAAESREPSTESTSVSTGDTKADDTPKQDPPKQEKPAEDPVPVISNAVYHVYAAEVSSQTAAKDVVSKLAEYGYKGTIIEQSPYFLIKVTQTNKSEEARVWVDKLKAAGFTPILTRSN
ncbi:MAG: SPOR domain-containing protein [Planctomycetales bacterium]|nr:SPOR domain-containing protein [bacterium]UNM07664.1 MAG: SPOR domain-containing protein [Planctomycetales bacterium]